MGNCVICGSNGSGLVRLADGLVCGLKDERHRLALVALEVRLEETAGPEVSPTEKLRGRQWCQLYDHWFVPAFGHGDGELVWIDEENILVCNAHYAEACEDAEREAVE